MNAASIRRLLDEMEKLETSRNIRTSPDLDAAQATLCTMPLDQLGGVLVQAHKLIRSQIPREKEIGLLLEAQTLVAMRPRWDDQRTEWYS